MALIHRSNHSAAFSSVFPPLDSSTPTPEVTPEIGISSPGQPFGGFEHASSAVEKALQTTKAWSTVTAGLRDHLSRAASPSKDFASALDQLTRQEQSIRSLNDWYLNEVTIQFRASQHHYETLSREWPDYLKSDTSPAETTRILQTLLEHVVRCMLKTWLAGNMQWTPSAKAVLHNLEYAAYQHWTSLVACLPFQAELQNSLSAAIYNSMLDWTVQPGGARCKTSSKCYCAVEMDKFPLTRLEMVGLGGDLAERALASAVSKYLAGPGIDKRCFQVDWEHYTSCAGALDDWVRGVFAPAVGRAVRQTRHDGTNLTQAQEDALAETAIMNLGRSRTANLFDYIKLWPHSKGAVLDIKAYLALNSISDKAAVCAATDDQLRRRLLHAGASTAEVLGVYVNLINVFNVLDVRGVLLEKVSPTIRAYIRGRSDAVNVLAESLFKGKDTDAKTSSKLCKAVAIEMDNAANRTQSVERMTNWADMNWVPDPIDAPLNHKSTWTQDVLTYLLSLFDHDELIKEIENVFADHLLSTTDPEIVSETTVLEHLKTRLDASKLQNLEVMLKDIRDSISFERRFRPQPLHQHEPTPREIQAAIPAEGITVTELYSRFETRIKRTHFQAVLRLVATKRSDLLFPKRGRLPAPPKPEVQATPDGMIHTQYRILSSSSWPQMQTDEFIIPEVLDDQMQAAEEKFSSLSGQRKLRWRPALSKMSVVLELEDRVIEEKELPASRVAVIFAFDRENLTGHTGITAEILAEVLEMEEPLVQEALNFWVAKRVLYMPEEDEYAVLERLDMAGGLEDEVEVDAIQSLKSQEAVLRENAPMFEAFILNMLSNGGAKEVGGIMGITNMMKMVLPTFTYGDDEVVWLLEQMKSKGLVRESTGDTWAASG